MFVRSLQTRYPQKSNIHLVGDSASGKTTFLTTVGTGAAVPDGKQPTSGLLHASTQLDVSTVPSSPRSGHTSDVTLAWTEFGAASQHRGFFELAKGGTRCFGSADALGIFFSARSHKSFISFTERWISVFRKATCRSVYVPFVFVVETHCDGVERERLTRDRRLVDIAMRNVFGSAYMFFQVDARNASSCKVAAEQIAVQMRHQPKREGGTIRVIGQSDANYVCGLIRAESALGELLEDVYESDWWYAWHQRLYRFKRRIATCIPWQQRAFNTQEMDELTEDSFVNIV